MNNYDIVILGSGPAGYTAAIKSAQENKKTLLIEKELELGGTCLNWGCIPTKALLHASETLNKIKKAEKLGIKTEIKEINFNEIINNSRLKVAKLNKGLQLLMKKNKVEIIHGTAKIENKNKIIIKQNNKQTSINAKNIIIAAGSKPRSLPNIKIDHKIIWDYKDAMTTKQIPKSLIIVGSGAIGLEFASFYNELGTKVTIVEIQDRILFNEDEEISSLAKKLFEKQGITFYTSSTISNIKINNNKIIATVENKKGAQEITANNLLLAIGVTGNIDNIGLKENKIHTAKGQIITNEWSETNIPGIFAIGDIAGTPWLAHKASHEAINCIEYITKKPNIKPLNKENIPACIYSNPQIGSIGLNEAKAKEAGYETKVGKCFYLSSGKAVAHSCTEGMIKLVFNKKTGELLGASIIGEEATEIINTLSAMKALEVTDIDIDKIIFAHPTLSELIHEAALCANNKGINS